MWTGILSKLGQWAFTFIVMPLLSKLWAQYLADQQDKREQEQRDAEVDKALKDYKEAATAKEKEDAFKRLIRRRA